MPNAMTSRERVLAAIRREPVDYVPCVVAFNPLSAVQRRGREWQFPWPADAPWEERLRYQVEELGLDQLVPVGVGGQRSAEGVTSRMWREGDILHKAFTTPCGTLHAAVRVNELWPHGDNIPFNSDFNIGHFVEPWVETEADLACLMQLQQPRNRTDIVAEARPHVATAKALAARYGLATIAHVGSGLTGAMHLFGASPLCMATVEQPELVDAYLEHEHRLNLLALDALGELGVDIVRRNGFYETADFYGPAMLERFLGDRLRREAAAAHAGGMVVSYTVHTGVMPILDYLAALPIDSLFGIDIAFKGVDPPTLRDRLCPTKCLWTGPSSTFHLWEGADATRAAVRQAFEVFGPTGLILSPCVSAHSIMPWASTLAMVDEWQKLR